MIESCKVAELLRTKQENVITAIKQHLRKLRLINRTAIHLTTIIEFRIHVRQQQLLQHMIHESKLLSETEVDPTREMIIFTPLHQTRLQLPSMIRHLIVRLPPSPHEIRSLLIIAERISVLSPKKLKLILTRIARLRNPASLQIREATMTTIAVKKRT